MQVSFYSINFCSHSISITYFAILGKMCDNVLMNKIMRVNILGDSLATGMGTSGSRYDNSVVCSCDGHKFYRRIGGHGWAQLLSAERPDLHIINNGCDGITSSQILRSLNELYQLDDDLVIILVGANDRKEINGMNKLEANLCDIIDRCASSRIVLLTPHPSTADNELRADRLFHMSDVASVICKVGEQKNVQVIDLYHSILHLDIEEIMAGGDGNHPTDQMALIEYSIIKQNLNFGADV